MKYISLSELPSEIYGYFYNIDRTPFGSEEKEQKGLLITRATDGTIVIDNRYFIESDEMPYSWLNEWFNQNEGYPEAHTFEVQIIGCTHEQAEQVLRERLGHDEDYGFEYSLNW